MQLWKLLTVAAVTIYGCNLGNGQDKRVDLTTGSIEISLVLPAGLHPFSEQKMALVREKGVAAKFIFSDKDGDLIAVINTFGSNADEKGLSKVGEQIKTGAEKQSAHVEWLKRDLIRMNGKKWLHLSFKEESGGIDLINDYFVTDWIGEYVILTFSSPLAKHEKWKNAFKRSAKSVRLGFIAESMELNRGVEGPRKKH